MKIIKLLIGSLLLSGIIFSSGCSNQTKEYTLSSDTSTPLYEWGTVSGETLTIWGDRDDLSRPYMTRAFERYQELTGNIIVTQPLSKQDLDQMVPQTFQSQTAEKPDIMLSYGGTNVENLNPDENFYDFTNAPWIDDLTDTALNQAVCNGRVIGLPHGESSVSGTLYNKEIFAKLHLSVPTTQEEFLQTCEILLQNGITPMYLPYAETTMLLYQFPMDSICMDKATLTALNNGSLSYEDIPEMKSIVSWYKTMSDRGYFGEDYLLNDWNGMDEALKSEKYAMMLCWDTWLYTSYTGNPSLIGMMPAFVGVPENGCFEGANISLCLVNQNSPHLKAALDFITFLADPSNYNEHYAGIYTAPIFNRQSGSITTPQYMEAESLIDKLFYESITWSRLRGFSQIDASYIQQYMQNECSITECLRTMNNSRLARAGIESPKVLEK